MSRTIITAVVAAVIVLLTAIAFLVSSSGINDRSRKDAEAQLTRAYQVVQRLNQLQGIDVRNKAERLAAVRRSPSAQPEFVNAIQNPGDRDRSARDAFLMFTTDKKQEQEAVKPDIIALVDKDGVLLAMYETTVVPRQWLVDAEPAKKSIIPALNHILTKKENVIISDIWTSDKGMFKVGAAPVVNPDDPSDIIGAVIVAYAQTARNAQQDRALLGTEIAYYDKKAAGDGNRVLASSFTRGGETEDTAKAKQLGDLLGTEVVEGQRQGKKITIDGTDYLAAAVKMPRPATKDLVGYPDVTAGAVVLTPLDSPSGANTVKMFVLMLGIGSLAIAMLGLYLAHRRLIAQVDQIELGVGEVINGNLDRTFRPVGPELDGLANGLNVMLARLLGRPEPGEEEFDEEGNPIMPGRVDFDEGEDRPAPDPDLAALAQESEPDYYKRVYTEYSAARKAINQPDDGSFENFITKLKFNESKLKAQYQCRAVRFRVVTKDGKVTLKPVPII